MEGSATERDKCRDSMWHEQPTGTRSSRYGLLDGPSIVLITVWFLFTIYLTLALKAGREFLSLGVLVAINLVALLFALYACLG